MVRHLAAEGVDRDRLHRDWRSPPTHPTLTPSAESLDILEAAAQFLTANPQFVEIRIEGHIADNWNLSRSFRPSHRRAQAVRNALASHGIGTTRMSYVGFGPERPIATNETQEGREANARVEIYVESAPAYLEKRCPTLR